MESKEEKTCQTCKKLANGATEEWCATHCIRYPMPILDCYEPVEK